MEREMETITPWYKQFWPWFIFGLPACVVVASIITVIIAFQNQDSLVADNYYKKGLGINRLLAQDNVAKRFALAADVSIDALIGELRLQMRGDFTQWPTTIDMQWIHPVSEQRDFSITLRRTPDGQYLGQLPQSVSGRWYLQLSAAEPELWRLKSEVTLDGKQQFSLGKALMKGGDG